MEGRGAQLALPALLAALTLVLGFEAGGYFADTTGWAAGALLAVLAVSTLFTGRPPRGLTWPLAWAGVALGLFAVWVLASAIWSGAPTRAIAEFDRALLYLSALLLFGIGRGPSVTLRRLPLAFLAAAGVLCIAGLVVRCLPDSWPFELPPENNRMDWPLSYENALGALAALGLVFALHGAAWSARPVIVRVLAASSAPIFAATLLLTFSRGAIVALALGVLAYLVMAPSRGTAIATIAAGIPAALAAKVAYDAELLSSETPRAAQALAQGEDLAIVIVLAAAGAALLMAAGTVLEKRVSHLRLGPMSPRARLVAAGIGAAAVAVVLATGAAGDAWDRALDPAPVRESQSEPEGTRSRLTDPAELASQTRPGYWRVARGEFADSPVIGSGAGTFALAWARERPGEENSSEGHSLYFETLGELGIVGGLLLAATLILILAALARGLRGPLGPVHAVLSAAALTWLLHAALDWDWEMPALTLWLFAAGGCALATSERRIRRQLRARRLRRALTAAGCLVIAITPVLMAVSQQRLDTAIAAFRMNDCTEAVSAARSAGDALGSRPEAYALRAYCAVRSGDPVSGIALMEQAIDRDPDNWEYWYGLALVQGAAGRDPRPAARHANRLNPRENRTEAAIREFTGTANPRTWRKRALEARLPFRQND